MLSKREISAGIYDLSARKSSALSRWSIHIGCCLGFWSKMDSLNQKYAVVFDSEADVAAHISSWDRQPHFDLNIRFVVTLHSQYASISEIESVGLPAWIAK